MQKKVEIFTLTLLLIFAFYCAISIGISWDFEMEVNRGNERLKYLFFQSSFENYKLAVSRVGEEFYPGFYTTLVSFIAKMFPKEYEFETWQLTNSLFSVLTVFGIYRISRNLFNKKVGKIIFLLYFLNPIFFGHMAMNPKDIIIAFANVWSTYIFIMYLQNQDQKEKCNRYILLAGLTVGLGTGMRLPFTITLIPLFFFVIIDIFFLKKIISPKFSFKKFAVHLLFVLLIAYLVTISFWPHVHKNIFTEPFKLALEATKFPLFGPSWILINGNFFATDQAPSLYIITNFFYKSPEFILLCYVIFIYFIFANRNFFLSQFNFFLNKIFLILFIFLFPTIVFIFLPYKIYDGLRLFLYLIPYFNIIPGLVIYYLIQNFDSLISKILLGTIASLFVYYLYIFVMLTPYQYSYLNLFTGNFSEAHKKFENDYWAISIKELVNKIPVETNLISNNEKVHIAFCGLPHNLVKRELNKIKKLKYEQKNLYANDVDYIMMTNRIVEDTNDNTLANLSTCFERFKGEKLVTVKRNGLVLSTIKKNLMKK